MAPRRGRARQIVDGYAPLKVTLRQVMCRLAAEGVLPHTPPMYRRLSAQLAQARREGRFLDLIDTIRQVHVPPAWPSAGAFVAEMPAWFRLDRTAGQKQALYVAAEKDTHQQLTGWLEFAGIPVLVVRGFSSQSYADVVRDRVAHEQREAHRAVVGDFDCSGEDIERDWVEHTGCWSSVTRVLLAYEQVRTYGSPATKGKSGDPRWPAFARRYGFDIERGRLRRTRNLRGSPGATPPPASDIYSVGRVIAWALTGQTPAPNLPLLLAPCPRPRAQHCQSSNPPRPLQATPERR
ncbi:hypothetical protein ACIF8W_17825 [Streptomyces sp. NPDC085639]|uniref:hypothetical protein n=1 Tax=Streptomyces sp. NPDC085639 TaxID=3365734 RepID=UPI0037D0EA5B